MHVKRMHGCDSRSSSLWSDIDNLSRDPAITEQRFHQSPTSCFSKGSAVGVEQSSRSNSDALCRELSACLPQDSNHTADKFLIRRLGRPFRSCLRPYRTLKG